MADEPNAPTTDPLLVGWTTSEIVRTLTRLSAALEKFEDAADRRYVQREVYDADMGAIRDRIDSQRSWVRELVAPIVTGLVVALAIAVFQAVTSK